MNNLFDLIDFKTSNPVANDTWRPEPPPSLDGEDEIFLNFETTGLKWFDKDLPIAASLWAKGRSWYLPWAHRGGGNLDEAIMKEWFHREVRNKLITNINTRFEVHNARVWGIDLEAQGNRVSDVAHYAALLDDHRQYMNLDSLIKDILGETPMPRLDETRMASYSAGSAAPRSMYNVESVKRLKEAFWPRLDDEDLQRVRQLEDKVIYVVCEMEKNGTLINLELLNIWIKETERQFQQCCLELYKQTGLKINPNSSKDDAKVFQYLKIPVVEFTPTGLPSFTDDIVKSIDHPTVKLLRHAKKLASLNSKFKKYQKVVGSDGILRYALHQLRASRFDADDAGETGTVTGRFTSTEIVSGIGINIQQVLKPEKQFLTYGDEYFIRNLHIPEFGKLHLLADAEQIQYRLFAHEANNPNVIEEYRKDPWLSFHKMMWKTFKQYKPDLTYKRTKDINFAKLFAAGPTKLALMLEFITKHEFEELRAQKVNRYHPKLAQTLEILKIYDKVLPETSDLLKRASELAKERGYIKTILGRRIRFSDDHRLHKALNARIQGSEADIVKTKAVELYESRKETGLTLRFQVHDEFDGDIPDDNSAKLVKEILNRQSFSGLRVPILWGVKTGTSWGDCSRDELAELRKQNL